MPPGHLDTGHDDIEGPPGEIIKHQITKDYEGTGPSTTARPSCYTPNTQPALLLYHLNNVAPSGVSNRLHDLIDDRVAKRGV